MLAVWALLLVLLDSHYVRYGGGYGEHHGDSVYSLQPSKEPLGDPGTGHM